MDKFMKRFIPILLAISVIACAIWYVYVYDRDFARDVLLSHARYLDSNGKQDLATWFYDQAYAFADNDEDVAIELAQQYKDSGNYTKAEYTLSRAITDKPSLKLYTELCKIYVEQDKLIDAVSMLDKISDPVIKEELAALRPAAPSVNMEPGYYTQYITLDFYSENGTVYISSDGEYPSVNEDAYAGSLTLPQGETMIFGIVVGDNGLVSSRGTYGYTIGGVIEAITFADPAIEEQVRKDLGLDEETVIYSNDLWQITSFTVPEDAQIYTDLTRMIYLTDLSIYNAVSEELTCLSSLDKLESLLITNCQISKETLFTVAAMENLTSLTIAQCDLSDISPLANAVGLEYLDLCYNSIKDISYLAGLQELKTLHMAHNALTDLTPLSNLAALETLNVSYNSITSIATICSNTGLKDLNVSNNLLTGTGPLNNLSALERLDLSHNALTDVSVLGSCAELMDVNVSNNDLTDISALSGLMKLRKFNCSYNSITALPDWRADCQLVELDASYNQISDVTPLRQMVCLNIVNLDYNPELSDIEPMAYCPVLIEVNLFGTKVIDVEILTKQSIIVNYNPTEVEVEITDGEDGEEAEDKDGEGTVGEETSESSETDSE